MTLQTTDYLILGGGTAGSVLAHRLSDDPAVHVTLVEAGGEAGSLLVQLPVGFARLVGHPKFDWRYTQSPDPSIHGRRFEWSAGRLLGGSSSINGQVYIRGTRDDFDHWARQGATGWDAESLWPYFLKSEDWTGAPHPAHGQGGPLSISPMREVHPLCSAFLAACGSLGLPTLPDYHDGQMEGAFLTVGTQRDGWRCSAEKAFLRPVRKRPNLRVITGAEARELIVEGGQAKGAVIRRGGETSRLLARREVIVSSGTVGSAALLLRSGIGPGNALQTLGLPVVRDLPGVGANLQEHPSVGQNRYVNVPTLNAQMQPHHLLGHLWKFINGRKGVFSAPAVQAMALARTRDGLDEPDVQLHFLPLSYDITPETVSTASAAMPKAPSITVNATICHPHSRGRVELDAQHNARINHRFLADERDVDTLVGAQKLLDRLFQAPAFEGMVTGLRTPDTLPTDDAGWADYVRWKTAPAYHPVGTCRMGTDHDAVVDPALRVHGISGLRVVDASVMPRLTSANTNAATVMIAERAADLIRA